jgi:Tol biopolymer transport system component
MKIQMKRWPVLAILLATVWTGAAAGQQRNAEDPGVQYRAAVLKEVADGDLKGAIELYKKVADGKDRELAAQALLRMAKAYESLGDAAEAQKAYDRIASKFSDRKEAAEARARLAALRPASRPAPVARMVSPRALGWVSADGRYAVAYSDWSAQDLVIHDFVSGTQRLLGAGEVPDSMPVFSPDNSQLAYATDRVPGDTHGHYMLRVVSLHGTNQKPRTLIDTNPSRSRPVPGAGGRVQLYLQAMGWTPDGKEVLVVQQVGDGTYRIELVSVANGTVRVLKSLKWDFPDSRISPDGRFIAYTAPPEGSKLSDIFLLATDGSSETAVVQHPANDHGMVWTPDGSKLLFLSDRTGTSSLWAVPVQNGKPAGPAELVKASFDSRLFGMGSNGLLYYQVSSNSRNIYRAELNSEGKASQPPVIVTDIFVNANQGVDISPDGQLLAYYSSRPRPTLSSRPRPTLVVKTLKTGEERVVPTTMAIAGGAPLWFPDGRSVWVRAISNAQLGTFRVNVTTGHAEEILQGVSSGISSVGNAVYSFAANANPRRLVRHDLETGRTTTVVSGDNVGSPFSVSPDGQFVAVVGQPEGGASSIAIVPATGGEPREVHRCECSLWWTDNTLEWSPDQKHVLFVLPDEAGQAIWRVPAAGGQAEKIVTMGATIRWPRVHPDGKSIYFTALTDRQETWTLENFLPQVAARK